MKKLHSAFLAALFCGFLGVFFALYLFLPKQGFSEKEKRNLAEFPETSLETVLDGTFESGFETWLADHAPGRDFFVEVNALYEQASFRNGLGDAVLCKGDRLAAAPEELDEGRLRRNCERIAAFAETTGLPTTLMLIPTAGSLLEDELPAPHLTYRDGEAASLIREALPETVEFLWMEDRYRALGADDLYYRTDHHYTSRGAYEACRAYAESLNLTPADESAYEITASEGFYGTNYAKSGLWMLTPDTVELWRNPDLGAVRVTFDDREPSDSLFFEEHISELDQYPVFLDGNHGLVTIETANKAGENLLIVRDSFGHCFAPFAAEHFHKIVLADLRYYRRPLSALVEEQQIDRVLVLYGMDTFLTDTNFPFLK